MNLLNFLGFKVKRTGEQIKAALERELHEYEFANNKLPNMVIIHPEEYLRFAEVHPARKLNGVFILGTELTGVVPGKFQYWYGSDYNYNLK